MKKKYFFSTMMVCLLALGLIFVSCDSDGNNSNGGDTRSKLLAGSGNWVNDDDPTTFFTFGAQSFGGQRITTIDFYMAGLQRVAGTCDISGDTVSAGGITFTVIFTTNRKMTVTGLSGDYAAANGSYTRQ